MNKITKVRLNDIMTELALLVLSNDRHLAVYKTIKCRVEQGDLFSMIEYVDKAGFIFAVDPDHWLTIKQNLSNTLVTCVTESVIRPAPITLYKALDILGSNLQFAAVITAEEIDALWAHIVEVYTEWPDVTMDLDQCILLQDNTTKVCIRDLEHIYTSRIFRTMFLLEQLDLEAVLRSKHPQYELSSTLTKSLWLCKGRHPGVPISEPMVQNTPTKNNVADGGLSEIHERLEESEYPSRNNHILRTYTPLYGE